MATGQRVRPVRTVLSALVGGAIGALVIGYATGQVVSLLGSGEHGAWAALGAAVVAAALGAFVGAAVALVLAFRDETARDRRVTALTTLVGGPVLLAAVAALASRIQVDWNVPALWLAVVLPASALIGRRLAVRRGTRAESPRRR
ncbi:hypothetical protein PU560_04885 [Georgenia sp. 10Sc9-8]|uniref:Major facilitator superfamily (MFS) profile domain-containing protein n=1 Tax=Georgenia halotolerans TaxID=3028317 RepID=A0ABT5TUR8_9MICO|nr:hypothetical protein [Georgenia halotolerans]